MNKDTGYKVIRFTNGVDIVANVISHDVKGIVINRAVYVSPDERDETGKKMNLIPFMNLVGNDEPQEYEYEYIMTIVKPFDAIIDMMTQNFSTIVQPVAQVGNVTSLILPNK